MEASAPFAGFESWWKSTTTHGGLRNYEENVLQVIKTYVVKNCDNENYADEVVKVIHEWLYNRLDTRMMDPTDEQLGMVENIYSVYGHRTTSPEAFATFLALVLKPMESAEDFYRPLVKLRSYFGVQRNLTGEKEHRLCRYCAGSFVFASEVDKSGVQDHPAELSTTDYVDRIDSILLGSFLLVGCKDQSIWSALTKLLSDQLDDPKKARLRSSPPSGTRAKDFSQMLQTVLHMALPQREIIDDVIRGFIEQLEKENYEQAYNIWTEVILVEEQLARQTQAPDPTEKESEWEFSRPGVVETDELEELKIEVSSLQNKIRDLNKQLSYCRIDKDELLAAEKIQGVDMKEVCVWVAVFSLARNMHFYKHLGEKIHEWGAFPQWMLVPVLVVDSLHGWIETTDQPEGEGEPEGEVAKKLLMEVVTETKQEPASLTFKNFHDQLLSYAGENRQKLADAVKKWEGTDHAPKWFGHDEYEDRVTYFTDWWHRLYIYKKCTFVFEFLTWQPDKKPRRELGAREAEHEPEAESTGESATSEFAPIEEEDPPTSETFDEEEYLDWLNESESPAVQEWSKNVQRAVKSTDTVGYVTQVDGLIDQVRAFRDAGKADDGLVEQMKADADEESDLSVWIRPDDETGILAFRVGVRACVDASCFWNYYLLLVNYRNFKERSNSSVHRMRWRLPRKRQRMT